MPPQITGQSPTDPRLGSTNRARVKRINPAHGFMDGSSHKHLAEGARIHRHRPKTPFQHTQHSAPSRFPAAKAWHRITHHHRPRRVLQNGSPELRRGIGRQCSTDERLIFSMFEAIKEDPHVVIHWPGMNNALSYRPASGTHCSFESFFAYGVRYIAIHHTGAQPGDAERISGS